MSPAGNDRGMRLYIETMDAVLVDYDHDGRVELEGEDWSSPTLQERRANPARRATGDRAAAGLGACARRRGPTTDGAGAGRTAAPSTRTGREGMDALFRDLRLRRPPARAAARVHPHRGRDPRPRHRRQHRDVRHRLRHPAAAAAVSGRRGDRAHRRVVRRTRPGRVPLEPVDGPARGRRRVVRAPRRLPGRRRRLGGPRRRGHAARRAGVAVALPPAAGRAPHGPPLHRGGGAGRGRPGGAAQPRRLDQPLRGGPRHRRRRRRPRAATPTPWSACSPRGSTSRTPTASSGCPSSCLRSLRRSWSRRGGSRPRWSPSAPSAGCARGCRPSGRPPRRAPSCGATTTVSSRHAGHRLRNPPRRRRARRRGPGGAAARADGRRVPARPAGVDRGHRARAAHRLQQRRRPDARAGG